MLKLGEIVHRSPGIALALCVLASAMSQPAPAAAETIALRSGNAPIGNPDPQITMLVGSGSTPLSPSPFLPADFQAACGGPNALVINPHPAWLQQLTCDPLAQWIGTDPVGTPASALYCHPFTVQTCCIQSAKLSFCWAGDDALGDGIYGGPNLDGVYINGVAVTPSINTGSYAAETQAFGVDITSMLQCGTNELQIYNRDAALVVSGVIYAVRIDITECTVPARQTSFGVIKSQYR